MALTKFRLTIRWLSDLVLGSKQITCMDYQSERVALSLLIPWTRTRTDSLILTITCTGKVIQEVSTVVYHILLVTLKIAMPHYYGLTPQTHGQTLCQQTMANDSLTLSVSLVC
jgi:hypothetical protein